MNFSHEDTKPRRGGLALRRLKNIVRPGVEILPVPDGVQADWNVAVPVRDGTVLRVNVFRPASGGPVPVIMSAHPYNKDLIPARTKSGQGVAMQYRVFPQPDPIRMSAWTSWEAPDPGVLVPRGYAVVNADLRGGGQSEGEADLFSDQEAEDYYDLIEWVAAQPWCTGKVGLEGVSYLAISQYKVAALHPPHLCAICPWEGFSDIYRDFARPGGVRELGFSVFWGKMTKKIARVKGDLLTELKRRDRDDWYESVTPKLERIQVPMLVCGSFSDHSLHSRGSFEAFRRAGSAQKWLYTHRGGKWSTFYSDEAQAVRLRFFDHFLRGEENGWDQELPVRLAIFEHGSRPIEVNHEAEWPPQELDWTELWLDAGSETLRGGDVPESGSVQFDTHGNGVRFWWEAGQDMNLIGPMALRVFVEVVGVDDLFLFAGVRKFCGKDEVLFEGSYGFGGDMVTKGWQRAAHRELDADLSEPWQPVHTHRAAEPLRPGEIIPVEIALLPQATRMRKGDRLRVDLRGTWPYPRDPLRGQFPVGYEVSPEGTCVLHTGGECASRLLVGCRTT